MILKKIHFAIDKTIKADVSQKILLKRYRNYSPNQSNVIVVIGGDGFMLETLKKYRKYNKPFYGVNKGTFVEPYLPHNKIGIMHLAAGLWKNNKDMRTNKDVKVTIRTVQGSELQKSLRYGKV